MVVIFQPDRVLLKKQIAKFSHYVKGDVLDVGSGRFDRYSDLFKCKKYIKLDVNQESKPDIIGSAEKIPLDNQSIDSIVCTQVLGDVKDLNRAISEFFRVLKPGGVVLLTESFAAAIHDEPNDFWRFTDFSLKYLFENNGFEIKGIDRRGGFWASLSQSKIRYLIDRLNLYNNFLGKLLRFPISICGRLALWIDKIDKSSASARQTLGWLIIAIKK